MPTMPVIKVPDEFDPTLRVITPNETLGVLMVSDFLLEELLDLGEYGLFFAEITRKREIKNSLNSIPVIVDDNGGKHFFARTVPMPA